MAIDTIAAATAQTSPSPGPIMQSAAYAKYLRGLRHRTRIVQTWQIGLVALLLGVWEIAPRAGWINPMLTSYPSAVAKTLLVMLQEGSLVLHTWTTLIEMMIGFCGGMALGLVGAVALWSSPFLYRVLDPFIVVLNGIPKIALVPIFYIWLGDTASIYARGLSVRVFFPSSCSIPASMPSMRTRSSWSGCSVRRIGRFCGRSFFPPAFRPGCRPSKSMSGWHWLASSSVSSRPRKQVLDI